jgi:hypothetical protein
MIRGPRLRLEDVLKQEENRSFRHQARSLRQTEKESVMEALIALCDGADRWQARYQAEINPYQ